MCQLPLAGFVLCERPKLNQLRIYTDVAGFDWYLREIIRTNKLASTWFHHIVEENFADRVVAGTWLTVVNNGKEGGVKLIIENWISCLPD